MRFVSIIICGKIKIEQNRTEQNFYWCKIHTKDCYQNNTLNKKQRNCYIQSNYIIHVIVTKEVRLVESSVDMMIIMLNM